MEHYSEGITYDEKLVERLAEEFLTKLEDYMAKVVKLEAYERNRKTGNHAL